MGEGQSGQIIIIVNETKRLPYPGLIIAKKFFEHLSKILNSKLILGVEVN